MATTIQINNLKLNTIIGTKEEEQLHKQQVLLNISIDYDATSAIKDDNLTKSVDYEHLTKKITEFVDSSKIQLLETLCDKIVTIILSDPVVSKTTVILEKPSAIAKAESVSIKISRERN